jgi:predicted esterase
MRVLLKRAVALYSLLLLNRSYIPAAMAMPALERMNGDGIGGRGVVLTPTSGTYANVMIFMHGLGDQADGWASLMPDLRLEETKFVLPSALDRPITLNGGVRMPGWSDIYSLGEHMDSHEDKDGFEASANRILQLVRAETDKGIPSNKIVIGGFSQGGALALHVALRSKQRLAGCIALSAWLPLRDEYPVALSAEAKDSLRIFQVHGTADQVVRLDWGQSSHSIIKQLLHDGKAESEAVVGDHGAGQEALPGRGAHFVKIPRMGHSSDPKEMQEVRTVLQRWLM